MWERIMLGVTFGLFALVSAIAWRRTERKINRIQQDHNAEIEKIRRGGAA